MRKPSPEAPSTQEVYEQLPGAISVVLRLLGNHFNPTDPEERITQLERRVGAVERRLGQG